MANFQHTIDNISGGHAPALSIAKRNQFQSTIGIDPDFNVTESSNTIGGVLRPVSYEDFSGAQVDAKVVGMTTTPEDSKVYTLQSDGNLVSYTSALASETSEMATNSTVADSLIYYNNYLYMTGTGGGGTGTDIDRFGPLDGTPAKGGDFWTSTLSMSALRLNYSYSHPLGLPRHAMHVHVDNKLYICDYAEVAGEGKRGLIHFIKTDRGTDPGDTNDGSTYGALDLPYNSYPVDIESFGNDLVVAAIGTEQSASQGGRSKLFFWDTVSDSFYRVVKLPDPYITALLNHNGVLYIWTGSNGKGYRVLRYIGGDSVEQLYFSPTGYPPGPAAVAGSGKRIVWGAGTIDPITSSSVYSFGSKQSGLPNAVQCIATTSATTANTRVTALIPHDPTFDYLENEFIVAHDDTSSAVGIEKRSGTYGNHVFRSQEYQVGAPFTIDEIIIPLGQALGANMTITPKLYFDREATSTTLRAIENTDYNGKKVIKIPITGKARGTNSYFLELTWSGTSLCTVSLPIIIRGTRQAVNTTE